LSNPYLLAGVGIEVAIILALIYVPPLARAFQHEPLPPIFWVGLACYAPILYSLDWVRKVVVRKGEQLRHHPGV
jgi:hypothetical protein